MPDDDTQPDDKSKTLDTTSEEFKAAMEKAVADATTGLRANKDELLAEKRKLKEEHDALKTQVADLGDLETVKAMVARFQGDNEAKLIADGKIDEVLTGRTEAMRKDAETRIGAATAKVAELETAVQTRDARIASLIVGQTIDAASAKLGCAPTAVADIRRAALEIFTLNEEGDEVEARGKDGVLLMGPDGKTNLNPASWLEIQKEACPHWWGPSSGGGAAGGGGAKGKDSTDAKQIDKMTGAQIIAHSMRQQ